MLVSGHSLGGLAVNSLADLSASKWSGFYSSANYIAYASPTQSSTDKVLNIGYENDPVFRALDGSTFNLASVGVHDGQQESATNNIVSFNDHYASTAWNVLPFSILNIPTWISHLPTGYGDGMGRIMGSVFYDLTEKKTPPSSSPTCRTLRAPIPGCKTSTAMLKPTPAARSSSAATAMT
nr:hypothetical protein GCM10020185_76850 [Pseudomonas brassicacearum subsp. brassicacearum]